MQKVVKPVLDYSTEVKDPNDWQSAMPGMIELVVASKYHYAQTPMKSAGFTREFSPPGADEEHPKYLAQAHNSLGSKLAIEDPKILDNYSFSVQIDATNTKVGDDFIIYLQTVSVDYIDWRWPKQLIKGNARPIIVHLHIGPSFEEYVKTLTEPE